MSHAESLKRLLTPLGLDSTPAPDLPSWVGAPKMSPALGVRLEELDLVQTRQMLDDDGYTVVRKAFSEEECAQLVALLKSESKLGALKNMLSYGDPLYFSALTNDKLMTLCESFLGPDFILMQYSATILGPGGTGFLPGGIRCYGLHSDQPRTNPNSDTKLYTAPRDRNNLLTCCIVLSDGYTADTGATYVVPGTHRLRRFPDPAAIANAESIAQPILAERGDVACWDGNVWHAFGVRQVPGERVVLHISYAHVDGAEAHDDYDGVPPSAFMGGPSQSGIVQLLQRDPTTGDVLTPNPRRRRLYWEEASLRALDWLPKALGNWMYKLYFNSLVDKELNEEERAALKG